MGHFEGFARVWKMVWIPGLRNHLSGPPLPYSHCLQGRRGEGETEKKWYQKHIEAVETDFGD